MILVEVTLIPRGDQTRKKKHGKVEIVNVGGSETRGNYKATIYSKGEVPRKWKEVSITDFPRKRLNAMDLLFRALTVLEDRKGGEVEDTNIQPDYQTDPGLAQAYWELHMRGFVAGMGGEEYPPPHLRSRPFINGYLRGKELYEKEMEVASDTYGYDTSQELIDALGEGWEAFEPLGDDDEQET